MLHRTLPLALILAAAAAPAAAPAAAAQVQERSASSACLGSSCPAPACTDGSACSSASLSFSAMHQPGGVHAPASSLEVMSWSWGASNAAHSPRDAGSGLATGKRQHRPSVGKVSYSDISVTKAPAPSSSLSSSSSPSSSAVSSVGSLSGGSGAAAASYARLSPPACSSSSSGACPGTISVQLASSRKGWDGCVKGSHIAQAQLRSSSGSRFDFDDLAVQSCDASSGIMTLSYSAVRESPSRPSTR